MKQEPMKIDRGGEVVNLAKYWNGLTNNDLDYVREELYFREDGVLFIYGEGGPRTTYGHAKGDGRVGGVKTIYVTPTQALSWARSHGILTVELSLKIKELAFDNAWKAKLHDEVVQVLAHWPIGRVYECCVGWKAADVDDLADEILKRRVDFDDDELYDIICKLGRRDPKAYYKE